MRVLGIETSWDVAGVAVADGDGLLAELTFRHRMDLARYLPLRIQEVLGLAGIALAEIDGVAVSLGPGSFTGLRIGVTAAKTLAFARGLPVAGVGTLAALAAENPAPEEALLCAVSTASATHLYAALFQWRDGRAEPRAAETLLAAQELVAHLERSPMDVVVVGQPGPHRSLLRERLGRRVALPEEDRAPRAGTVARLGRLRLAVGDSDPVHALVPRYLRPSAAEARRARESGREAACPSW